MRPTSGVGSVGSRVAGMLRAVGVTVDGASRHSRVGSASPVCTSREGGIG
jgi:phosphoglycerate dehydrogenase-like enzyme